MIAVDLKTKLETLLDLLKQERERAKALDMPGLQSVVAAKEELLVDLNPQPGEIAGCEELLKQIDEENRRNAYLLWSGLKVVRELVGFFNKSIAPSVYNPGGYEVAVHQGGRLLSGKV